MFVVLLLQLSMMGFAQDTLTTSSPSEIESFSREAFRNSIITSTVCHFTISRSSLKNVLKLMRDDRTNIIELDVWIESANNATNRSLVMTHVQWANEIGRTLYSFMLKTAYPTKLITTLANVTMAAGVRNLSVAVYPENEKCLLFQNHTSDNVFSDILKQLYHASDEDSVYELCRTHDLTLNCCTISAVGKKEIPICFDSSSIAIIFPRFSILFSTLSLSLVSVIVLLILIHFNKSAKRSSHYAISDSPMSLSTIIHEVFIVEHGAVLSSGKKLLVSFLVIATVLPVQNCAHESSVLTYFLVCPWVFFYVFSNIRDTSELSNSIDHKTSIGFITLPFNLKFWWSMVSKIKTWSRQSETNTRSQAHFIPINSAEPSDTNSDRTGLISAPQRDAQVRHGSVRSSVNNQPETKFKAEMSECGRLLKQSLKLLICRIIFVFLLILYLVITLPSCFVAVCVLFWTTYLRPAVKKYLSQLRRSNEISCYRALRTILTGIFSKWLIYADALIALSCFSTLFSLLFHLAVGLFLNGKTFSPYFVLISAILFYAWSNWRSTVETKYVELITNIYEVCDEIEISRVETTTGESENVTWAEFLEERNERASNFETTTNDSPQTGDFSILINEGGEIAIPIDLYEMVRETFLPYDVVLFHYFAGLVIVVLFAYFLYVLMSLFQTSGISSSVEALTSISGAMLPIVFSLVWRTNTEKQNAGEVVALKSKLKRVLQVCCKTNTEIKVKFIGKNPEKASWYTLYKRLLSLVKSER